jgi:hypothetical protein
MDCVVSPVDHKILAAIFDVRTTELPSQKASGPLAVITGGVGAFVVLTTTVLETAEQPFPSVKVTK